MTEMRIANKKYKKKKNRTSFFPNNRDDFLNRWRTMNSLAKLN